MAKTISAPKMTIIPDQKTVKNEFAIESNSKTHVVDPRPCFRINETTFPAIKGWIVGQKYKLEIEAEQVSSSIETWGDDKGKMVAEFRISGIMVDSDVDDKDDKGSESEEKYPKAMIKNKK